MENIILTNNKELRLVSLKVGIRSTLRIALPMIPKSATNVETIVTNKSGVPYSYSCIYDEDSKRWHCDITAGQFQSLGKQKYEIAYKLDGKQFWDGSGWIETLDATSSGIVPPPDDDGHRYVVSTVNGIQPDANGNVQIPLQKIRIIHHQPKESDKVGLNDEDILVNSSGGGWYIYRKEPNRFSPICGIGGEAVSRRFSDGLFSVGVVSTNFIYVTFDQGGQKYLSFSDMNEGDKYEIVIRFSTRDAVNETAFVCENDVKFVTRASSTAHVSSIKASEVIPTLSGQTPLGWVCLSAWKINAKTIHLGVS